MDWVQFLAMLGSAILGGGGISGVVIYLWQKKIDQRYAKELEGYKAGYQKFLDENRVRFNWWHEEQAKAIKEFYSKVADLHYHLEFLVAPLKSVPVNENEEKTFYAELFKNVADSYTPCILFWLKNKIFFPDLDKDIEELFCKCRLSSFHYETAVNRQQLKDYQDARELAQEFKLLLEKLRKDFQKTVQGEKESAS